jgi:hypothetical protein
MHPASFSIKVFGVYGALTGIGLMLMPKTIGNIRAVSQ